MLGNANWARRHPTYQVSNSTPPHGGSLTRRPRGRPSPPRMATWSSLPVANRQGRSFWDFSSGGGAAFHRWLSCYLGPQLPTVGQRRHRASDPATLRSQAPDAAVMGRQNRSHRVPQLPRHIPQMAALGPAPEHGGCRLAARLYPEGGNQATAEAYHRKNFVGSYDRPSCRAVGNRILLPVPTRGNGWMVQP